MVGCVSLDGIDKRGSSKHGTERRYHEPRDGTKSSTASPREWPIHPDATRNQGRER